MSYFLVSKTVLTVASMMLCLTAVANESIVEARKAASYVGKSVIVCGSLAEIKHLPNRHYLNLDKKYPNQSLTILLWNKDYQLFEKRFGKLEKLLGNRLCAQGKVGEYGNKLQVNVVNLQFLRFVD